MGVLADRAERRAEDLLAVPLPRRWRHVQAVAIKADRISTGLSAEDSDILVASAWLHDIGYAPPVVSTGLHALDGARFLRGEGFPERVCGLVAHHSCAIFEAAERGLADDLTAAFTDECSPVTDALWYADMTTGPDGESLEVADRLAEVRQRYGPDHLVTRFWSRAEPTLVAAVQRTQDRIAVQPM
jgi:hypothetical protein